VFDLSRMKRVEKLLGTVAPGRDHLSLSRNSTASPVANPVGFSTVLTFAVNGEKVVEPNASADMTLLEYLRNHLHLTGAKLGCGEGGCGACTVMVSHYDKQKRKPVHRAINACLAPLCSVEGCHVITVEGIGSVKEGLHPIQDRLAKFHGSQCGFCTPGIVMALYAFFRNNPRPSQHDIEEAMDGNLCRCTGYRPILDGAKSLAADNGFCGMGDKCCRNTKNTQGNSNESADIQSKLISELKVAEDNKAFVTVTTDTATKISQLPSYTGTAELIFPPFLANHPSKSLKLSCSDGRTVWFRPTSLLELLELRAQHPGAKIIVGNTEVGIETKFKNLHYPVLISGTHVPQLNQLTSTGEGLVIGPSVTLTRLYDNMKKLTGGAEVESDCELKLPTEESKRLCKTIANQLRWFSSTQIRNACCLGGNICTASPISDMNPVLQAAGAVLTLSRVDSGVVSHRTVPIRDFFLAYRKIDLKADEVLTKIFVPFPQKFEYIQAFKQARRRDDDIAIVTSCMRVKLVPAVKAGSVAWSVERAAVSFGGMGATTFCAKETESTLAGKEWTAEGLESVYAMLQQEVALGPATPGGQIEFRQALCQSFLFKFYLFVCHAVCEDPAADALGDSCGLRSACPPSAASAVVCAPRPVSRGTQVYQKSAGHKAGQAAPNVGADVAHLSGQQHTTGEAVYTDDIADPPFTKHGALLLSTRAHAKVVGIDASAALAMPGGCRFIHAADVPAKGTNVVGDIVADEELFVTKETRHVGEIIGVLVADTQAQAKRAVKHIKVQYEDLPCVVSIKEAIAQNSVFPVEHVITDGDVESALSQSDLVVEGEARVGGQEHFYLEVHNSLVIPSKEHNEMLLWCSTQNPTVTQEYVAHVLGIDWNRVTCKVKRLGGGFGGKETRSCNFTAVAAVAANKLGVPVRLCLDRDEDMAISGQRHAFYGQYRVGINRATGKFTALHTKIWSNAGYSHDLSVPVLDRALFHLDNCYKFPNVKVEGRICKTNLPSNTAFRGFGGPQGMLVNEMMMDKVAYELGMDPADVRAANMYTEGDTTHFKQQLTHNNLQRLWAKIKQASQYENKKQAVAAFNQANRYRKQGLALIPTKFGCSFTAKFMNQGAALVLVYRDGSVLITHGGTEMGQGLHTKMCQIAADALEVPLEKVHISETATDKVPNTSPTAASMSSDINGAAVLDACNQIKRRLEPLRQANPGLSFSELAHKAYFSRINLSAQGFFKVPDVGYDFTQKDESQRGQPFAYFSFGVALAVVEVDVLTGDHTILSTDIVMDVGRSINPAVDIGQVEGAFIQGVGWCTIEELIRGDEEHPWVQPGRMFSQGPGTYKLPGFLDVPIEFNVSLLKDAPNPKAVHSSKAIGEPPLFLASCVFFAIKDAIRASREQNGHSEYFNLDSPATSERIRMACLDKITQSLTNNDPNYRPKGSW